MKVTVDTYPEHNVLIVDKANTLLTKLLRHYLKTHDSDVFISPVTPAVLSKFSVCIFINGSQQSFNEAVRNTAVKSLFIFIHDQKTAQNYAERVTTLKHKNIKIIHTSTARLSTADLEKIFWFTLTESSEVFLNIYKYHDSEKEENTPEYKEHSRFSFTPKKTALTIFLLLFLSHLVFIPPLAISTYYLYKSGKALEAGSFDQVPGHLERQNMFLSISKKLYAVVRPTLLFFSVARYPENVFQLNDVGGRVIMKSIPLYREGKDILGLMLKKTKSKEELNLLVFKQSQLMSKIQDLYDDLSFLYQKFPTWTDNLKDKKAHLKSVMEIMDVFKQLLPHFDNIFAKDGEKKYLLLFANNMELRPGGGFIGSFGIATMKEYTLKSIVVYDVYDADGQLNAHIDPPDPIRKYLQQPHWFLRDSAFSPDFKDNYIKAKEFLGNEMQMSDFSGGILITTTAIQNLLEAMGGLYLPDYNENVNKDNFYLKAQLYAEKDFFPGSIQKKGFLSAVMTQMINELEEASPLELSKQLLKSVNEKQLIFQLEDQEVQNVLDYLYWSGRMINPVCTAASDNCVVDYLFPVDANLGVNKANFFVSRSTALYVSFDKDGNMKNRFSLTIRNDSPNDVFPGGTYKNYLQMLLPGDSEVTRITKNDTLVEEYDESQEIHKTIGFYVEIPPKTTSNVIIEYQPRSTLQKGKGIYQLVVQKQIGSPNYEFSLTLALPNNMYVVNQNFSPLVKDNSILYNTTIKADKIFFIELFKE